MTVALMALISTLAGLVAARQRAASDTFPYSAVFPLPSNTFHATKTQTEEVIFACSVTICDIKITVNMPLASGFCEYSSALSARTLVFLQI